MKQLLCWSESFEVIKLLYYSPQGFAEMCEMDQYINGVHSQSHWIFLNWCLHIAIFQENEADRAVIPTLRAALKEIGQVAAADTTFGEDKDS